MYLDNLNHMYLCLCNLFIFLHDYATQYGKHHRHESNIQSKQINNELCINYIKSHYMK